MFRIASRAVLRSTGPGVRLTQVPLVVAPVTTGRALFWSATANKKQGPGPKNFKSAVLRWVVAIGGTYYYLTSSVFAEENTYSKRGTQAPSHPAVAALVEEDEDEDLSKPRSHRKLDDIRLSSRTTGAISDPEDTKIPTASEAGTTKRGPAKEEELEHAVDEAVSGATTPEELEEEAGQQGAFNPDTGEINWDCPCLGGMAHGPCGEEFKSAFSCFVYSKEEPKGVDCIEKFKTMQDCFRKYPEHYGGELEPDEEDKDELAIAATADTATTTATIPSNPPSDPTPAVPVTTSQVQEKVHTEVPAAVEREQPSSSIPAAPDSSEKLSTEQVKAAVEREQQSSSIPAVPGSSEKLSTEQVKEKVKKEVEPEVLSK